MGKVSTGISKEEFEGLKRIPADGGMSAEGCSICQERFEVRLMVVFLPCKHFFHEECI